MKPGDLVIVVSRNSTMSGIVMTQKPGIDCFTNPVTGRVNAGAVGIVLTSPHMPEMDGYKEEVMVLFSGPALGWCMVDALTLI